MGDKGRTCIVQKGVFFLFPNCIQTVFKGKPTRYYLVFSFGEIYRTPQVGNKLLHCLFHVSNGKLFTTQDY